ncbi:MAG TPA: DUF6249 domain-containing protein [Cellvibrionaceae bacterium]
MNLNRFTDTLGHTLACLIICIFMTTPLLSRAEESPVTAAAAVSGSAHAGQASSSDEQVLQRMIRELGSEDDPSKDSTVPVVALLLIFGGPVLILITLILQHYRSQKLKAEFRRECVGKLIDAGKEVPASLLFFDDLGTDQTPAKTLNRGLNFLGLGIGITVFLWAVNGLQAGTFGLIFIGLGCAQLISWKLTHQASDRSGK